MGADLNPASLAPGGNWNLAGLAPEPDVVMALLGWWWPATSLQTPQEIPEPDITRCPGSRDTCVDKLPEQRQPPAPAALRWWGCHGGTRVGTSWCVFCSRWGGWELACWLSKFTELTIYPLRFVSVPLSPLALNSPAPDASLTLIGQVINALSQWHGATKKSDSSSQKGWAGVQKSGPHSHISSKNK